MTKREWQERQWQDERLAAAGIGAHDASRLRRINASLRTIGERQCSEEMSERTATRLERKCESLERTARKILVEAGAAAELYIQTDPRGCAVYVIPSETLARYPGQSIDSIYDNGIAVYS